MTTTPLTSNGLAITRDQRVDELRPSDGFDPAGDYERDGYALLRGLLDRDEVLAVREAYLTRFAHGGADLPHGVAGHPAHGFVRSPMFQRFIAQPALHDVAKALLGDEPSLLPRTILRDFRAGSRRASRAHQDHSYLDRGTERVVTAWIPLGDCSVAAGGLVYLEGSHRLTDDDLEPVRAVTDRPRDVRPLSHDLAWVADTLGRRWLAADFEAGDVVFHSPRIVHASLDSTAPEPRISTDVRFIPVGDDPDPRWCRPWAGNDGN